MRRRILKLWHAEAWLLISVLTFAGLLLTFGLIADEVMEGSTLAFDLYVMLALRSNHNLSDPTNPSWALEIARDITAMGSFSFLESFC